MAQSLELNIKTTSDVPQAMDKAKTATTSFGKQVGDIQKKFSTAFKDVFLSFLGPMALVGIAMNQIGNLIEENMRKREEANKAAIDGTNELISAEDRYWARKMQREKQTRETKEQAKLSRQEVTLSFLESDPRGKAILERSMVDLLPISMLSSTFNPAGYLSRNKEIQDEVQKMLAADLAKNPELNLEAVSAKKKAEEDAAKARQKELDTKPTSFKGPEGFSNVVGVGANPVIEAMTAQLEETKKTNEILLNMSTRGQPIKDFTKQNSFQDGYGDQM